MSWLERCKKDFQEQDRRKAEVGLKATSDRFDAESVVIEAHCQDQKYTTAMCNSLKSLRKAHILYECKVIKEAPFTLLDQLLEGEDIAPSIEDAVDVFPEAFGVLMRMERDERFRLELKMQYEFLEAIFAWGGLYQKP
jgi:hypothetical protein